MTPETIGVTVTFKEPLTFHLRLISLFEESALRQKMFGKTEAERETESYQNNVDLLADLSVEAASGIEATGASFGDDVRAYFTDKTVLKERLAEYAVRGYFLKLQPDLSFQ